MILGCALVSVVAAAWCSCGVLRGSPIQEAQRGGEVEKGDPGRPASREGTGGSNPPTTAAPALPTPARGQEGRLASTAAPVAVLAASTLDYTADGVISLHEEAPRKTLKKYSENAGGVRIKQAMYAARLFMKATEDFEAKASAKVAALTAGHRISSSTGMEYNTQRGLLPTATAFAVDTAGGNGELNGDGEGESEANDDVAVVNATIKNTSMLVDASSRKKRRISRAMKNAAKRRHKAKVAAAAGDQAQAADGTKKRRTGAGREG